MSHKATTWAWEQEGLSPIVKIILLAMADAASDGGKSFSSNKTICKMCGLVKEDTISKAQATMIELKIIADTGRKSGETSRVKVFQLPRAACKVVPPDGDFDCFEIPRQTEDSKHPVNPPPNGVLNPPRIPRESPANPPFDGVRHIRGTVNGEQADAIASVKAPESKNAMRDLTDRWMNAFQTANRHRYTGFDLNGAKEGAAAARLLKTGLAPSEIISIAVEAWKHGGFNCEHAVTLAGFASRFENIRRELERPSAKKESGGWGDYCP